MQIVNKTKLPITFIRDVVRFVKPPGIKGFKVVVRELKSIDYCGRGGPDGVSIKFSPKLKFPRWLRIYQYGQLKGRRYWVASLPELIIYLLAHELMHTKQGQRGSCRGKVWGARGRYSEIETESYAIRKLREFRRIGT